MLSRENNHGEVVPTRIVSTIIGLDIRLRLGSF